MLETQEHKFNITIVDCKTYTPPLTWGQDTIHQYVRYIVKHCPFDLLTLKLTGIFLFSKVFTCKLGWSMGKVFPKYFAQQTTYKSLWPWPLSCWPLYWLDVFLSSSLPSIPIEMSNEQFSRHVADPNFIFKAPVALTFDL